VLQHLIIGITIGSRATAAQGRAAVFATSQRLAGDRIYHIRTGHFLNYF